MSDGQTDPHLTKDLLWPWSQVRAGSVSMSRAITAIRDGPKLVMTITRSNEYLFCCGSRWHKEPKISKVVGVDAFCLLLSLTDHMLKHVSAVAVLLCRYGNNTNLRERRKVDSFNLQHRFILIQMCKLEDSLCACSDLSYTIFWNLQQFSTALSIGPTALHCTGVGIKVWAQHLGCISRFCSGGLTA